jgi:hypothetical protein
MLEKAVMTDTTMLVRNIDKAPCNLDSRRDAPRMDYTSYPSTMMAETYMPGRLTTPTYGATISSRHEARRDAKRSR